MGDATLLLTIALASIVVVPWIICAVVVVTVEAADDRADQFPDGGRVASRPGSTRFAPGASFAVSASGNDPSRGGTVRAFNDGE